MTISVVDLAVSLIRAGDDKCSNDVVQNILNGIISTLPCYRILTPINQVSHSAWIIGTTGPILAFVGHSDVVSAANVDLWKYAPFAGVIERGDIHGRGSVDMRSSLAAFVSALIHVWDEIEDKIRIAIIIAGDEETTGLGSPALLNEFASRAEIISACIVGEPSAHSHTGDRIRIGRRGSLSASLTLTGTQSHTAYVSGSQNILHKAIEIAHDILHLSWPKDPEPWPDVNLHITNLNSGTGENNVTPALAKLSCNLRFGPSLTREQIIINVEEILRKSDVDCQTNWTKGCLPYVNPNPDFTALVSKAIHSVCNVYPLHSVDGGTSDGRFFACSNIPTVEVGTPAIGLHQVNEHIRVNDLQTLVEIYKAILVSYSTTPITT